MTSGQKAICRWCWSRSGSGSRGAEGACYRDRMPKVRKILPPVVEGKNVTVAQARAAWRELVREGRVPPPDKAMWREKTPTKSK